MSLFEKINKTTGQLKCLSGFHKGTWEYVDATSCQQELTCERCGHQERTSHERFSKWLFEKEGLCVQSRECRRCKSVEFRTNHHFNYKVPVGPMDCRAFNKVCGRCGGEEEEYHARPQHEWSSWRVSRRIGQRYRYCKHCGRREFDDFL